MDITEKYRQITAPVFNVQTYSIHDGPGIRVTVFLKGCPLRCLWCANPESNLSKPQLMTYSAKCTGCGKCVSLCPAKAREMAGKDMTVDEVLKRVEKDRLFIDGSGGGITVSGGECLMHPEFTEALLRAAKEEGLHTAVESCAFASRETVDRVFRYVDLALLDIKHMDSRLHEKYTGVYGYCRHIV